MNVLRLHQELYERSDGRVGHRMLGVPTLLLRSTGRRTGVERTSGLVYAVDGDSYLVVASNGGAPRAPGWMHNVLATGSGEIQIGRRRRPVTASAVWPDDPGYERRWDLVNGVNKDRYRGYASKTSRRIPIVVLTPQA